MFRMLLKFKFFTLLLLLLAGAGWGLRRTAQWLRPEIVVEGQQARISISAEDIERILELNGASVKVLIETDTAYISQHPRTLLGFELWKEQQQHRLSEQRTWLIKAGVLKFELKGQTLELSQPEISSREHLVEVYQCPEREGIWNPVTLKQIEIASRNRAVQAAIDNGLLREAQLSVEAALYGILPTQYQIIWKNE